MDNRTYLAIVLKGGLKNSAFRQMICTVDDAGQVSFSQGQETFSEDGEGGGYIIHLKGPGGRFEIWMGNGNGNDCTVIAFRQPGEDAGVPVTPVEILEAFDRWKISPGVQETTKQAPGLFIREYRPALAAGTPADTPPSCPAADTSTP